MFIINFSLLYTFLGFGMDLSFDNLFVIFLTSQNLIYYSIEDNEQIIDRYILYPENVYSNLK